MAYPAMQRIDVEKEYGEYGIVFDTADGTHGKSHHDMGTTVFATVHHRDKAMEVLREIGYHYFMQFGDVQGAGLCWAWRYTRPFPWTAGGSAVLARRRRRRRNM